MHLAFVVQPAYGHVLPTLELVTELVRRGHRISFATGPTMTELVVNAGAQAVPLPSELPSRPPSRATFLTEGWAELTNHHLADSRRSFPPLLDHFLADRPDAVCYDNWTYTGRMLAQVLGAPEIAFVTSFAASEKFNLGDELHGAGFGSNDPVLQDLYRQRAAFAAEHGVSASLDGLDGTGTAPLNLVFQPREFQFAPEAFDDRFRFVGPLLGRAEDDAWADRGGAALVYISLGTAFNADATFYRTAFEAVDGAPWRVLMATGTRIDPAELGTVPANVELRPHVPQLAVLRHARAHVTHSGMNSMMESLALGVPVVAVPQMPEQDGVARRGEALGAARRLDPDQLTAAALREAITTAVDDEDMRAAARKMQRIIANCGGAVAGADAIEAFAARPAVRAVPVSPRKPRISVVIPTYNRADLLSVTLESLTRQSLPATEFEVIVSDDGSSDHTAEVARSFQGRLRVRYTFQEDLGFRAALARNNGARLAAADLIAFIDTGMLAGPNWLQEHLAAHREADTRRAVLGYVYGFHPQSPLRMDTVEGATAAHLVDKFGKDPHFQDIRRPDFERCGYDLGRLEAPWFYCWTGNMSVHADDFWMVGGFDESYRGWGVEDVDLGYRLYRDGVAMSASRAVWTIEAPHERDMVFNFGTCRTNALQFHHTHQEPSSELYWTFLQRPATASYETEWVRIHDSLAAASADVADELEAIRPAGSRVAVLGSGGALAAGWPEAAKELTLIDLDPRLLEKAAAQASTDGMLVATAIAIGMRTTFKDDAFDDVIISPRLQPIWKRWGHHITAEAHRIGSVVHTTFDEKPDPLVEDPT